MESTNKMIDDAISGIHRKIDIQYAWAILRINKRVRIHGAGAFVTHDDIIINIKEQAFDTHSIPFHIPMPEPIDYWKAHQLLYRYRDLR